MNVNLVSDQEVVDYIESSATLIENLKTEIKKLASEKEGLAVENANLISEKTKLEQDLYNFKAAFAKKAASKTSQVETKRIFINKEQADLIANNLINLQLIKNANVNDVSNSLQEDTDKLVQVVNGLIAKVASNHTTGRGIAPEKILRKTLTEEEQLEKTAFYTER